MPLRLETQSCSLSPTSLLLNSGIIIELECFRDVFLKILQKIFYFITDYQSLEEDFSNFKAVAQSTLQNSKEEQPYLKADNLFLTIVKEKRFTETEMLSTALSKDKTVDLIQKFKIHSKFSALLYGNIEEFLPNKVLSTMKSVSNGEYYTTSLFRQRKLRGEYVYHTINKLKSEVNNVVVNYYQIAKRDYKKSLLSNLTESFWGSVFYEKLRTEQQLGYVVYMGKDVVDDVMVEM